ncbi:class I SAM-dependent methyltransferase [Sphingomonas flavalba]|uniref:class I SAM-dependent methyltransferase n=1 Tax=Sphingomonas flavalba TaxID=2559804 RepID=UPI003B82FE6E
MTRASPEPAPGAAALTCAEVLRAAILLDGPVPISHFMAAANAHYYATRDPLGTAGDFVTAPEISQMFGEMIGLWLADLWDRAGRPPCRYVELGPGRGTLAADALRAMKTAGLVPPVHFVETSPLLAAAQAERVSGASRHAILADVPDDLPLLVVANEFFDALPIRQLIRAAGGWRERHVGLVDGLFLPTVGGPPLDAILPDALRDAAPGSIVETCPAAAAVARLLGERLAARGGAAIVVDYGYSGPAVGETLQAVSRHAPANPFEAPGERDLTAHVDFAMLAEAARAGGAETHGPLAQGEWLRRIGIEARAAALANRPDRTAEIVAALARLTAPDQMGALFKALALTAPGWPHPEGFA